MVRTKLSTVLALPSGPATRALLLVTAEIVSTSPCTRLPSVNTPKSFSTDSEPSSLVWVTVRVPRRLVASYTLVAVSVSGRGVITPSVPVMVPLVRL